MPTNKIIFGFVGLIASGKGTACAYFKDKHNAGTHRFSTMLRDVLTRLYIEHSREHLQNISSAIRQYFGEESLSKVMVEDVTRDAHQIVAIDGVRRPGDVEFLSKIPGFVLVQISTDIAQRYERITKRGENSDDGSKTFEQFKLDHEKEAELQIADIAKHATEHIDNNGTLEDLYQQLDALIVKYS